MKFPLEKHKHNLKNRKITCEALKQKADRAYSEYISCLQSTDIYESQIKLAQKEGKDGFDAEVYGLKRLFL